MRCRLLRGFDELLWVVTCLTAAMGCFSSGSQRLAAQALNHVPELVPLTNWVVGERRLVTFTNLASDVDVPPQVLRFSVGPGAPEGINIDPMSGVFYWRPTEIQGGTTNMIEVIVSDNGVPSLSATQQFQIVVRDTLPDFALTIGSTNLLLNETGRLSVGFSTLVPVTNVAFVLAVDTERLRDVTFTSRMGENAVVKFAASGPNRYAGTVNVPSSAPLQGALELGELQIAVIDRTDSAIVSVEIPELSGIRSDGRRVGQTATNPGRVYIVISEPLLEIADLGRLRVYLLPGHTGSLFWTDPSTVPWVWSKLADFAARSSKIPRVIDDPSISEARFYRVTDPHRP